MNVQFNPARLGVDIGDPTRLGVDLGDPVSRYVVEPYVSIEETEDGAEITCTAHGETTTGTIYNGVSPDVEVTSITGGHQVSITDAGGTETFNVMDGVNGQTGATPVISVAAQTLSPGSSAYANISGTAEQPTITFGIPQGDQGVAGADGSDGADGVSPEVTIAAITGGHSVTITDADHPGGQTFNVMDGTAGTTTYNDLTDKPSINGTTLSGDVTLTASDVGALPDSYTAPVTSVNSKTGAVSLSASDVGALPTGTNVAQVEQNAATPSSYTYWRPLLVGASSNATEGFTPTTVTDKAYAFKTVEVQPSTGTISAAFKGNLTGNVTGNLTGDVTGTASGNYVLPADGIPSTDLEDTYAASHTAGGAAERAVSIPYGEVDSTSTNTAYTVTVPGVYELRDGIIIYVRNDVVTSTTNFTLNVNGLGAKPVYQNSADATRIASTFSSAVTWLFIYNEKRVTGGCWDAYYGYVNSNTIGYQVRTNSTTLPVSDKCYRYRLLFTSADGTKFVPANDDTQTSAAKSHTTCTTPIDPFGTIMYYGTTTALSAGSNPSKTILWQQYVVTLGYSFNNANAALTLTANKPVYITATPQSDGSAILDYFTQALPNSNDGKIYIFLGVAVDATTVEMQICHPIYYHDGTSVKLWLGKQVQNKITASGILKGDGAGGVTAAVAGTDYLATAPVTSVNGQTGAVSLTIPSKTSDLNNDSNFITAAGAPVQSVNGATGAVTIATLPTVSSPTDDGKVLRVVSGVWTAVSLPSASGVSF